DALAGRRRALGLADPHPERPERRNEQAEVEVEGDEAADRELARVDHSGSDEKNRSLRDQRNPGDQRDIERALPVRLDRLPEHGLRARAELVVLLRLLRDRLDAVDPA